MDTSFNPDTDLVTIKLSRYDCSLFTENGIITDRNNPFDPAAKVDIRKLEEINPDYEAPSCLSPDYQKLLGGIGCKVQVLGNNDFVVYVPYELPQAVATSSYTNVTEIPAQEIKGDPAVVPKGGIRIEFGEVGLYS